MDSSQDHMIATSAFSRRSSLVVDAVADPRAIFPAPDQSRILQDPQVFGHRRLRQRQLTDNLAANLRFLLRQDSQDAHAGRMTDRLRQEGELLIRPGTFNRPRLNF